MTRVTSQPSRRERPFEPKIGRIYTTVFTLKRMQCTGMQVCPDTKQLLMQFVYVDAQGQPVGGRAKPETLELRVATAARLLMQVD